MTAVKPDNILSIDRELIWHPYSTFPSTAPIYPVEDASGVSVRLADGRELIDGMASWWSTIHGYNNPVINEAITTQLSKMSHVMFGGLTHEPAVSLCSLLVDITPDGLNKVFLSDSGSVSVEVALKMAIQYWQSQGKGRKCKFLSLRSGYHGDTFGAMSVCDPTTGMHHLFSDRLMENLFAPSPDCGFSEPLEAKHTEEIEKLMAQNAGELAAVILEPIVQGAGGMKFYSPDYLKKVKDLCEYHDILLIADEIATGFGRTGALFACDHADISPDILCLGKAMTGGYMTLAATLCNDRIARGICEGEAGVFMHGPTFMGNPLACATAFASIKLLLESPWHERIKNIEDQLVRELESAKSLEHVKDVRVLGAIGVIEMKTPVNMTEITEYFVESGVWLRPFGTRVYIMPPYIIQPSDLTKLTTAMVQAAGQRELFS